MKLFNWINRLMAFYRFNAGEEGGGAAVVDRGDDFTPTDDDTEESDASKAAAKKLVEDIEKGSKAAQADPDDEDEETETEDEEKANDKAKGKKDSRIPLKRHKELLEKQRERTNALEAELNQLKAGKQAQVTNEQLAAAETNLLKLEAEYDELVTGDDPKKAAAKMKEIRTLERSIMESKSALNAQIAEARAIESVTYKTTLERLEEAYPVINPDHDDYDKDVADEVLELFQGFVATGKYSRADALKKAAKHLLKPTTVRQEKAVDTDVRVDKDEVDAAKAKLEKRAQDQRKKNADTAAKQPPDLKDVGDDHDKHGGKLSHKIVMGMSQEEFAKLKEEDLAKLRGDDL